MGVMVRTDTRFGIQWKIMELRQNRAQGMERTARGDGEAEKKREKQVLSSQFVFNVWIRCHARSPMGTECFSVGHFEAGG